ncbi:MAG TPA: hemerythrin domain-containing protein [Thermaerobacter sp.]
MDDGVATKGPGERALEILHEQHRRLASLLEQVRSEAGERPGVVAQLMDELDAHRRLEQEAFYPALRLYGGSGMAQQLAARAREHRRLDELAERLAAAVEASQRVEGAVPAHGRGRSATEPAAGPGPGAGRLEMAADGLGGPPGGSRTAGPRAAGGWNGSPAPAGGMDGPAAGSLDGLIAGLAEALHQHIAAEEGELFAEARRRLDGDLARIAGELVRGMEEFRFDYDDVVEGTFPASDPPATMAAPRLRTPRPYARSRK